MPSQHEKEALNRVPGLLEELLCSPSQVVSEAGQADLVLRAGRHTFVVEFKSSAGTGAVLAAIETIRMSAAQAAQRFVPILAVPFMGKTGDRLCVNAKVSWLDLSGNARIRAPGLNIHVQGRPNLYKRRGRPANVFAPKSSRVSRLLLLRQSDWLSQREIAGMTSLDEGFVSRIVRRLEGDGLLRRNDRGALKATDPDLLLDTWHDAYDFGKHRVQRGHITAKSGPALAHSIAAQMEAAGLSFAFTGLAAAWLQTHFAAFRLATVYVHESLAPSVRDRLAFREEERGANAWIVTPADSGVFAGTEMHEGLPCVNPVQVYLDLKSQPERATEAARELRKRRLRWTS